MLTVEQARSAADRMPHAALAVLGADGHVAPLVAATDEIAEAMRDFWSDPGARAAR
jgi:hypothetical protein